MSKPIEVRSHVSRDFLQNAAYFNTMPKVVWEYVSNSVDNAKPNQMVNVEVRISERRVVISDDASGMSRGQLADFFQMHGENVRRSRGERVRGRYGTGKCAAFGIADTLRVETYQNGILNSVELTRQDIERSRSGNPFTVKDIHVDKPTTQKDGTTILISGINVRNLDRPSTIAYVERHLGRQLTKHNVVINDHVCEYQEPVSYMERRFSPPTSIASTIGNLELVVKVSPTPLDKERAGIDILSFGNWHDTYSGDIETDLAKRVFGYVDMRALEEKADSEKIPPFDNTRNMTLNKSNPMVVTLLGWVDQCLHDVARELEREEKDRRATEEAKRLTRQARELAQILNDDFRRLRLELEKIRRATRLKQGDEIGDIVPGEGDIDTEYRLGGAEHGEGTRGDSSGPGEEDRPGPSLLEGSAKGGPSAVKERSQKRSTFEVDYRKEQEQSPRSHYEKEIRTIVMNLDHPQLARAAQQGGIDGKAFREMSQEIAFVEYALALCNERLERDPFYESGDMMMDIRETINRVSRIA